MHPFDRPLLLGLMALEQELVSAEDLVAAFRDWRRKPEGSLSRILVSKGKLSAEHIDSLQRLVADTSLGQAALETDITASMSTRSWHGGSTPVAADSAPTRTPHVPSFERQVAPQVNAAHTGGTVRFRAIHLHAQGGLGQVFLAEDSELNRRVALKEIKPDAADDEACRRRFVLEAEITGNLEHPGIVPVYGLGVYADGRPFYAMRFIEGETLSAAIARFHQSPKLDFSSLGFRQLLARFVSACNAIGYAHNRGFIHRDIKPQNIMLGPFGETLVVDWGLAKAVSTNAEGGSAIDDSQSALSSQPWLTLDGDVIGTPAYMSPEQASGQVEQIGTASDIFSLGATLYALLTGQSPQHGAETDVLDRVREGRFAPARSVQPTAPRALAAICLKAMAKLPSDRYASAVEFAADIERWLADEPASAYAEPWSDTAFRWMRKHRLSVAVATALLAVVSVSLAIGYTLVRKERDIARTERSNAVAANDRAQQSAAATRQVVEQFLIQIGDDRWSAIPGFEDVRIEMVRLAVEKYQQLLAQQPSDGALAADTARAFRRCANLYRMVGQYDPASKLYEQAIGGYQKLAAGDFGAISNEQQLCETLLDRATLIQRLKGPKAAEKPTREAGDFAAKLRGKQPNSTAARQVEARAATNLADVLRELGRYDEAIRLAQASSAVHQKVADADSRLAADRISATFSAMTLAGMLREVDRYDEATAVLKDLDGRVTGYLEKSPGDTNLRYAAAVVELERALIQANRSGPSNTALSELDQATAALQSLAEEFPRTASFRRKLAEALTAQADLQRKAQDQSGAADSAREAIEVLEQIDKSTDSPAVYQSLLAAAHITLAEIELERGNASAAKDHVRRASERMKQARAFNDESPKLAELARRITALAARIP